MDEACFQVSGYVNSQSSRVRCAENAFVIHEEPLHPEKFGIWCDTPGQTIVGSILFEDTVDSTAYLHISNILWKKWTVLFIQGKLQQNNATCQTPRKRMAITQSFFTDRGIFEYLWPPGSPNLTPTGFFLGREGLL
jgi:hypothetical protein